jgi:hypothetical protein
MKQFLHYFKITLSLLMLLQMGELSAQFINRPATCTGANKPMAASYLATNLMDGEGKTGLASSAEGLGYFYWNQPENPVTFSITMNASSTVSNLKFYGPWGTGEHIKDFTLKLYDGTNTLLGIENNSLPSYYNSKTVIHLSKKYLNVAKVEFIVVNDHNTSTENPKRVSLLELVLGDLDCTTTTISPGTNQVLVLNTAIATPIQLATTTNAVGANITGLPAGLTGMWQSNKITIFGTPTQTGVFNYSLSTGVGCAATTGTITVSTSACTTSPASVN